MLIGNGQLARCNSHKLNKELDAEVFDATDA